MKLFKQVFYILLVLIIFYGAIWLCFLILPKWIDVIIGFPLAIYLMILFMIKIGKNG
jgi:hypothetical protein